MRSSRLQERTHERSYLVLATVLLAAPGCKRAARGGRLHLGRPALREPIFRDFENGRHPGARVFDTEETKSTGVLNRLIAEGAAAPASVLVGDPVRPSSWETRPPRGTPRRLPLHPGTVQVQTACGPSGCTSEDLAHQHQRVHPPTCRDRSRSRKSALEGQARWPTRLRTTTMYVAALFTVWATIARELSRAGQGERHAHRQLERRSPSARRAAKSPSADDTDDAHERCRTRRRAGRLPDQDDLGTLVMPNASC